MQAWVSCHHGGLPANFNQLDNPVFRDGPAATALYGKPVPIYAPASWQQGSSLAHLDEARWATT